jgi:hypothetical protein
MDSYGFLISPNKNIIKIAMNKSITAKNICDIIVGDTTIPNVDITNAATHITKILMSVLSFI